MGITNQQIAELWKESIQAQRQMLEQFTATVDRFIEHDRDNHKEFRETLVLLRERQDQHGRNWQQVWKMIIVPVGLAIIAAVLSAVLK